MISLIKIPINLNCNSQKCTVLTLFQGVVMPEIPYYYHRLGPTLYKVLYFLSNGSMFIVKLGCELAETQTDCDCFGLPFPVPGCGVKISVMQQYLTAWTQALVFTQEAQVWVSHRILCQLGFSHSQTCCTTYWFLPVCLSEWVTSIDSSSFKHRGGKLLNAFMQVLYWNTF